MADAYAAAECVVMRLASFNVENLFARPKAMAAEEGASAERAAALAAHAEVSTLLDRMSYLGVEARILELLDALGVKRSDTAGKYAQLRKIRGQLLTRPRTGEVRLVAKGRGDWLGWVELKTVPVVAAATDNTARVIDELNADIMTVIEADNRPDLDMFAKSTMLHINALPYEQVMVLEGNDDRGIDVGLLARPAFALREIRTHIFDADEQGQVFSRDCCEYHLETPGGDRLVVMANHFKSKGYSTQGDPQGAKRRARQAVRVRQIYEERLAEGFKYVAITGDLNDTPDSASLKELLTAPGLTDISAHPDFDWNGRQGTYGSSNEQIDYILLSAPLFTRATGGGVFRKGVWRGSRTKNPWEIFPTLTAKEEEASDHAAIYADFEDL
jgi:endonuclease/exonuclease/phosphatase family metal-dependent hydrolase